MCYHCTIPTGGRMATQPLARHGSEAGYRAEIQTGDACDKCIKGHRVFNKQYTKTGKAAGLSYARYDVIDHLYSPGSVGRPAGHKPGMVRAGQEIPRPAQPGNPPGPVTSPIPGEDRSGEYQEPGGFTNRIKNLVFPDGESYVNDNDIPEYLHSVNPD